MTPIYTAFQAKNRVRRCSPELRAAQRRRNSIVIWSAASRRITPPASRNSEESWQSYGEEGRGCITGEGTDAEGVGAVRPTA